MSRKLTIGLTPAERDAILYALALATDDYRKWKIMAQTLPREEQLVRKSDDPEHWGRRLDQAQAVFDKLLKL